MMCEREIHDRIHRIQKTPRAAQWRRWDEEMLFLVDPPLPDRQELAARFVFVIFCLSLIRIYFVFSDFAIHLFVWIGET